MTNVNVKSYACANYADVPKGLMDKFAHEPLLAKVMLTALTAGLVLIDQPDGVAYLAIHIGLLAGAVCAGWTQPFCGAKQPDPRLVSRVVVLSKALQAELNPEELAPSCWGRSQVTFLGRSRFRHRFTLAWRGNEVRLVLADGSQASCPNEICCILSGKHGPGLGGSRRARS